MSLQQACLESLHRENTVIAVRPDYCGTFPDIPVYSNASRHRIHSIEGPFVRIRPIRISCRSLCGETVSLEYLYPVSLKRLIRDFNKTAREKYECGELRSMYKYDYGYQNWCIDKRLVGGPELPLDTKVCRDTVVHHIRSYLGGPSTLRFRLCTRAFTECIHRLKHTPLNQT